MTKVSQLKESEFVENVRKTDEKLFNEVKDAETIAKACFDEYKNYAVQTATSWALARLRKAAQDASAKTVMGLIFGAREQTGDSGKGPSFFALIQGKKGIEVKNWRREVKVGEKKYRIPDTSIAKISVMEEFEKDSDKKTLLISNIIGHKPKTIEEAVQQLKEWGSVVALKDIPTIVKNTNPSPIYVIRCKLASASSMKKYQTENSLPIWKETSRKVKGKDGVEKEVIVAGPHVSLRTKRDGDTMAWIRLTAPNTGTGITPVILEDFNEICKEAVKKFEDPIDQAELLGSAIDTREVIVIGAINRIQEDNEGLKTVNIAAHAILEGYVIEETTTPGQQTLTKPEKEETKNEDEDAPAEDAPTLDDGKEEKQVIQKEAPKEAQKESPKETPSETPKETSSAETTEEAPALEDDTQVVQEQEASIEPETEAKERVDVEETLAKEIENKLLYTAGVARKVKKDAGRTLHIKALKTLSIDDIVTKLGLGRKYPVPVIEQVYEDLVAELEAQ